MNDTQFWIDLHDVECNQKYGDDLPYSFHLKATYKQAEKFKHLIPNIYWPEIVDALWGHDSIEDCRISYKKINMRFGTLVANIIYACSEEKGKTRGDRHSQKYLEGLRDQEYAIFVKLCDMIANVSYGILTNSTKRVRYKDEYPNFKKVCYDKKYDEMFLYLEKLLEL